MNKTSSLLSLESLPNQDSCLILLTLDYLKALRRTHYHQQEEEKDNKEEQHYKNHLFDYDYMTLAIWALTKCFKEPKDLQWNITDSSINDNDGSYVSRSYKIGNDPFLSFSQVQSRLKVLHAQDPRRTVGKLTPHIVIPTLDIMEGELLHVVTDNATQSQTKQQLQSSSTYIYDDSHYSNSHRYYKHHGLDSIPLTLPTIVQEGLASLQAKTRMEAESDLRKEPMYTDFYQAVKDKGYFQISTTDIMIRKRNAGYKHLSLDQVKQDIHRDRLQKVMTKYRLKAAAAAYIANDTTVTSAPDVTASVSNTGANSNTTSYTSNSTASATSTTSAITNKYMVHVSKDTISLPSVPTASTDCDEDYVDDEEVEGVHHGDGKVENGERDSKELIPTTTISNITTTTTADTTRNEDKHRNSATVICQRRKIVPLKKAIVSSVPLMPSSHKSSVNGDHDSVHTNILFNEDDLCSRVSQKSGRSSICSTMTDKPEKVLEAEAFKAQGNECMKEKKYEKAKHFYTQAIEVLPFGKTSHVYYCNRAAALLSMRNFSEAVYDAEQSIELKPRYSKAYCRLGLANFFLGNYQEAIDAYTLALKYDPENEKSKIYLERSQKKLQVALDAFPTSKNEDKPETESIKTDECNSNEIFQKSLKEDGKHLMQEKATWVKEWRLQNKERRKQNENDVYLQEDEEKANHLKFEGNKAMARKQYDEAISLYSQALRLSPAGPSSHIYYTNRSAAYCHLGRYEDSESDAERALALEPESTKAYSRLGLSRYFLRDYEGAVDAYESAVYYEPTNRVHLAYLEKARQKLLAIKS